MRQINKNYDGIEFLDFHEFTRYLIFEIFHENSHSRNGDYQENRKNHRSENGGFPSKMTIQA